MGWPTFDEQLSSVNIPVDVLSLVPQELMEHSFLMPLKFDKSTGCLTVVTSKYIDAFADITSILKVISEHSPDVKDVKLLSVTYENFAAGYNSHFKQQFTPTMTGMTDVGEQVEVDTSKVTSEQTKLADNILRMGIDMNASDIHITPVKDGPAKVEFRIDGKLRDSGIMLSREDVVTVCNIYKRNAGLEVNNLIGQDGRFTFLGRDFRLSTQPYGGDNMRNKIVLRVIGFSNNVIPLDKLSFKKEEIAQLREIIHKPNGIMLVCGPTGEGKSTTLYSCLQELVDTTNNVIVTVEDPIEKYINGIGQTQVRIAESERNSLTFSKALRSMLRQDPNVIMVGEIRDGETALVAVQASQTGHLILSTLHVRNSISVFRRLGDMGANISGFAEQIVGITSQRLLSLNCPHCRKRVVSELNKRLRKKDLEMLEWGIDDEGREGYITYESKGCDKCGHTGFVGRVPLIEIIIFDNYLRDYFAEAHGLIDIEKYLRKNLGFRSLWDKGMERVVDGSLSLEELVDTIEPDVDIDLNDDSIPDHTNVVHEAAPVQKIEIVEPVKVLEREESSTKVSNFEKSVVDEVEPVVEKLAIQAETEGNFARNADKVILDDEPEVNSQDVQTENLQAKPDVILEADSVGENKDEVAPNVLGADAPGIHIGEPIVVDKAFEKEEQKIQPDVEASEMHEVKPTVDRGKPEQFGIIMNDKAGEN